MPVETRRRYRAPNADVFASLMQRRNLAGFLCEPMPPLQVHDLYLDTEDAALLAQGMLLRLREHGGLISASLRPADAEGAPTEEAAHARFRDVLPEGDGPVRLPEGTLREAVEELVSARPLQPLLRFRQYRTPRALYDGDRLAGVLSLDVVSDESAAAERSVVTNEVEAELVRDGRLPDLVRLDEDLLALGFEPDPFAKFEGGLMRRSRGENAPLFLLPREREDLEVRRHSESAVERRRAEVILLAADGLDTRAISKEVSLSPSRVRHWRHAFRQDRMRVFDIDAPEAALSDAEGESVRTFRVTDVLTVEELFDDKPVAPNPPPESPPSQDAPSPEQSHEPASEETPSGGEQGAEQDAAGGGPVNEDDEHPPEEAADKPDGEASAPPEEERSDDWVSDDDPASQPSPFDTSIEEMLGEVLQAVEDRVRAAEEADADTGEALPPDPPVLAMGGLGEGGGHEDAGSTSTEAPAPPRPGGVGFVGDAWFDVDAAPPREAEENAMENPPPPPTLRPEALLAHLPFAEAAAKSLGQIAAALRALGPLGPDANQAAVELVRGLHARLRATLDLFSDAIPEREAARLRRTIDASGTSLAEAAALGYAAAALSGPADEAERLPFALAQTVWSVERRRLLDAEDPLGPLADRVETLARAVAEAEGVAPRPVRLAHRLPAALWARYGALRLFEEPMRDRGVGSEALSGPLAAFATTLALTPAQGAKDVLVTVERVRTALGGQLAAGGLQDRLDTFIEEWVRPGGPADPAPLEARRARAAEEERQAGAQFQPLWEALLSERFREALGRVSAAL